MADRKPISKRVRFAIFARDNFTCVYCGRQPPTITLVIEHVVPVCQGGGNQPTNLKASCEECNQGKGGKTIGQIVPTDFERLKIAQELAEQRRQLQELAECQKAADDLRQAMINRWCECLGISSCSKANATILVNLVGEFGASKVLGWMELAAIRTNYKELKAIKYICGCARNTRQDAEENNG